MDVREVFDNRRQWGVSIGDAVESLRVMPAGSVQMCVTSPPYYGLRSYLPKGHQDKAKEIGLEETPEKYVERMVGVFHAVWRVLRDDGVLWLNIGDSYANDAKGPNGKPGPRLDGACNQPAVQKGWRAGGLKKKDRIGIPHMLAFALRADGWYFRDEICWFKPNAMPGSMRDRTTAAHEFMFMFSKSARYYYDNEAIKEPVTASSKARMQQDIDGQVGSTRANGGRKTNGNMKAVGDGETRNKRSVWRVPTRGYKGSHYAVYPPALISPCILAGTSAKGCCPVCGSPWVRVVERVRKATRPGTDSKVAEGSDNKQDQVGNRTYIGFNARWKDSQVVGNRDPQRHVTSTETTGWEPSCACGGGDIRPGDLEVIASPTGERTADDPSAVVGRAGFSRPRGDGEGTRHMTRYEQRKYADQLKASAHKSQMAEQAGPAFAHYLRTDRSGARPIPADLLARWVECGWVVPVEVPEFNPLPPIPCVVLDPFVGSGTTLAVSSFHGRRAVGCDLDDRNVALIEQRMAEAHTILLDKKVKAKPAKSAKPVIDLGRQLTILDLFDDTPPAGDSTTQTRAGTGQLEINYAD